MTQVVCRHTCVRLCCLKSLVIGESLLSNEVLFNLGEGEAGFVFNIVNLVLGVLLPCNGTMAWQVCQ